MTYFQVKPPAASFKANPSQFSLVSVSQITGKGTCHESAPLPVLPAVTACVQPEASVIQHASPATTATFSRILASRGKKAEAYL
jgi:hypothetical protein